MFTTVELRRRDVRGCSFLYCGYQAKKGHRLESIKIHGIQVVCTYPHFKTTARPLSFPGDPKTEGVLCGYATELPRPFSGEPIGGRALPLSVIGVVKLAKLPNGDLGAS